MGSSGFFTVKGTNVGIERVRSLHELLEEEEEFLKIKKNIYRCLFKATWLWKACPQSTHSLNDFAFACERLWRHRFENCV